MSLTTKQQTFVNEYLKDLNITQAAVRAGYSQKTANQQGSRLFANVKVKAAIDAAIAARAERTELSQDMIVNELRAIAFARTGDVAEWGETVVKVIDIEGVTIEMPYHGIKVKNSADLSDEAMAAVAEVSEGKHGVQIKMHQKVQALQLLGKHLGMFVDKHEVKTDGPPTVNITLNKS